MPNPETYPYVGMGITISVGSDRYPGTITKISNSGKSFTFKHDTYERTDKNGMSEQQEYTYAENPNGHEEEVSFRKDGKFRTKGKYGSLVTLGKKEAYFDPHK